MARVKLAAPILAVALLAGCGSSSGHESPTVNPVNSHAWFASFVKRYNAGAQAAGVSNGSVTVTDAAMYATAVTVCHDMQSGKSDSQAGRDASATFGQSLPSMMVNNIEASMPDGCPK